MPTTTATTPRMVTAMRQAVRTRPLVIAHRGLSSRCPENTVPAFQAAIDARADMVELDFRTTVDGQLVCSHDESLGRCVGPGHEPMHGRKIGELNCSELDGLDMGGWKAPEFTGTRMPRLREALELLLPHTVPAVEQKSGTAEQTLRELEALDAVERVVIHSFNWDYLRELHRLEPRLALGALGNRPLDNDTVREIHELGVHVVHWNAGKLTLADVESLHESGYVVWTWTLNSEMLWRGAQAMGLDAITTDCADQVAELLEVAGPNPLLPNGGEST